MKKHFSFFIIGYLLLGTTLGQTPSWSWVKGNGGSGLDETNDVVIDSLGNIYQSGWFKSSSFDIDTFHLYTNNESSFIIRYNSFGSVIWVRQIGIELTTIGKKCIDRSGNLYINGTFLDSILILDQDTLHNSDYQNFRASNFLCKLNTNNQVQWTSPFMLSDSIVFYSMAVDDNENIYLTGEFKANQIILGTDTLFKDSVSFKNSFVLKMDSLRSVRWTRLIRGNVSATTCVVDRNGEIIVGGVFGSGLLRYGLDSLSSNGASDLYVLKVDTMGNLVWLKNYGGSSDETLENLAVDRNNNIYLTGEFYGSDFSSGTTTLVSRGAADGFIVEISESGQPRWGSSVGDTGVDFGTSISSDAYGNVYWTGNFRSDSIIMNGIAYQNVGLNALDDYFLEKFDSTGSILWAYCFGSSGEDFYPYILCDNQNGVYFSSNFAGPTLEFGGIHLINNGSLDIFISKIDIPLASRDLINDVEVEIYPNPTSGLYYVNSPNAQNNLYFILTNIEGKIVMNGPLKNISKGIYSFNIENLSSGVYVLNLMDDTSNHVYRICKI